mgnify:CR=1 FL=1
MKDAVISQHPGGGRRTARRRLPRQRASTRIPSRAMKADALGQWLISKQWMRWVLVYGVNDGDRRLRRRDPALPPSAIAPRIVEERAYEFKAGSRRTDTGEQQVREQMTQLTQRLPDHDVVIVADERRGVRRLSALSQLGPAAGGRHQRAGPDLPASQPGAMGRNPAAAPLHARLRSLDAGARLMPPGRRCASIGEAVTRTNSADAPTLHKYIMSDTRSSSPPSRDKPLTYRKVGPAAAPADPARDAADAGVGVARRGRLPAPAHAARLTRATHEPGFHLPPVARLAKAMPIAHQWEGRDA